VCVYIYIYTAPCACKLQRHKAHAKYFSRHMLNKLGNVHIAPYSSGEFVRFCLMYFRIRTNFRMRYEVVPVLN
jgi:hypothetical protein